MKYMKVKVKELKANPFRDLNNYPFNQEKIERLKQSIEQTGFWDNILARQVNGEIQIAYGHHRLKALREVYSPDYLVEVPIKDLSDELMLKIMANENMDEWGVSVGVIDETVKAVINFLKNAGNPYSVKDIEKFLNWPFQRVANSSARLTAIKDGVDKKAVEAIPTEQAATAFAAATKKETLTTGQQRRVAKRIAKGKNYSPEFVKRAVKEEAEPPTKKTIEAEKSKQFKQFDNYLSDITERANDLKDEIAVLRRNKAEIKDFHYSQFENRIMLKLALEGLQKTINNTLKELNND